jgi:DtxR family Mn-dependent transcriptional regulator
VIELSRKAEDYLEAIYGLSLTHEQVKTKDIADVLNVRTPSVVEMVKKLDRMELVVYRKYDGVKLTPEGEKIAMDIRERYETFKSFLTLIQVPVEIAARDACIMEHELDRRTIQQIRDFVEFMNGHMIHLAFLGEFKIYTKTKQSAASESRSSVRGADSIGSPFP